MPRAAGRTRPRPTPTRGLRSPGPSPDPRYQEPYPDTAHATDVYVSDAEHPYRVDARIARAARRACGEALPDTMLDLTAWKLYRVCRFIATQDAHEQLSGAPEEGPPER